MGINPGLLWSFEYRPAKHYRCFSIPKGAREKREIIAPKVALKVVQKWLSFQWQRSYVPPRHVFGFVPGKSHIKAAQEHRLARWTYSVDIANFFPSTPKHTVAEVLERIGYSPESSQMLARLCCYQAFLAQGAPSSPVVSNLALADIDGRLLRIAERFNLRLSRYADDIVFSGREEFPEEIRDELGAVLGGTPWVLSPEKTRLNRLPGRLKVHGLLVHGDEVRLTKRYRNKLRTYAYLRERGRIRDDDMLRVSGHLRYGQHVVDASD